MFKITEFSAITGLTIRTLHYYDEIGLLVPDRKENGHRLYSYANLVTVNEIILLKSMGITLEEISQHIQLERPNDLTSSLRLQRKLLIRKAQEIKQQLANLEWLIDMSENEQTLEEAALKKAFIENNPLKNKISTIWDLDFTNVQDLQQLKNNPRTIPFDRYFKKIAQHQGQNPADPSIQNEISLFVSHLQKSYGASFRLANIPNFAKIYLENSEAKDYLLQYGKNFNQFLYQALVAYAEENDVQKTNNKN
jgi:DNA-binding transcriptional MerR regulator